MLVTFKTFPSCKFIYNFDYFLNAFVEQTVQDIYTSAPSELFYTDVTRCIANITQ